MREGVFASPGEMSKVSLDKASPPCLLLFSGSDPGIGHLHTHHMAAARIHFMQGPSAGVGPSGLAPSPGRASKVGNGRGVAHIALLPAPGSFCRAHFEDG